MTRPSLSPFLFARLFPRGGHIGTHWRRIVQLRAGVVNASEVSSITSLPESFAALRQVFLSSSTCAGRTIGRSANRSLISTARSSNSTRRSRIERPRSMLASTGCTA